jgi:hypothetical protein
MGYISYLTDWFQLVKIDGRFSNTYLKFPFSVGQASNPKPATSPPNSIPPGPRSLDETLDIDTPAFMTPPKRKFLGNACTLNREVH